MKKRNDTGMFVSLYPTMAMQLNGTRGTWHR